MKLTAKARRDDAWWIVECPEIRGLYTQAKRLDQIEAMVKDAANLLTDEPEEEFEVIIKPQLSAEGEKMLRKFLALKNTAKKAEEQSLAIKEKLAKKLLSDGYKARDVADLMGINSQGVSQLPTVSHRSILQQLIPAFLRRISWPKLPLQRRYQQGRSEARHTIG